jgi:hypothetical protein
MADIASMRFQSARHPDETGTIALTSDGGVRIDPSDTMIESLAALEQEAVERSGRFSNTVAFTLIGLGLAAAAAGWLAGRIGGKLRERMTARHAIDRTSVEYVAERGFRLKFKNGPLRTATLTWSPGEYDADEAQRFYDVYSEVRQISKLEE